jgi:hypothetical protein
MSLYSMVIPYSYSCNLRVGVFFTCACLFASTRYGSKACFQREESQGGGTIPHAFLILLMLLSK